MKIIFWMVGTYAVFTIYRILTQFHLLDFGIYYQAVQDIQKGVSMYANPAMKYPMSAILILWPIGWMPYVIAEKVWTLVSLTFLTLSLQMIRRLIPSLDKRSWALIIAAIIMAFPYKFTLGLGQINLFILACFTGSLYAYLRSYDILAGMLIAGAAWLKITPLVLLLFFLRKRAYKTIVVCVVTYLLGWVAAGQLWGWEKVIEFFRDVVPSISTIGNAVYYNQAFTGVLARIGMVGPMVGILNYLVFGGMLVMSYRATSEKREEAEREIMCFGLFVTSMILGAGLAWQHYFVWLIIPFVGVYAASLKKDNVRSWGWRILFMYLLIALNIKNPSAWVGWMSLGLSHVTVGALGLWYLCLKACNSLRITA
ncbi:MAG: glycosyltransferase family 87 protein [bacterium]